MFHATPDVMWMMSSGIWFNIGVKFSAAIRDPDTALLFLVPGAMMFGYSFFS